MYVKLILTSTIICSLLSCKKEDPQADSWAKEVEHISIRWKVDEAFKNSSGAELDNGEDVSYDWDKWSIQFWNNNAYKIIEYSPDSTKSIIESGTWQLSLDGEMILRGSKNLIDFDTGAIIDEGTTERFWLRKKNQDNQFWVWIENSFYASTGVLLKMTPY